jgi:hypothetical protein
MPVSWCGHSIAQRTANAVGGRFWPGSSPGSGAETGRGSLADHLDRLWGAPRIHGELLKLGIEVAQSTVAKYMARSGRGRSQTWKTFLHNHAAGIGAMDFLIVPTVGFRLLFVLVILRHERRRLISLNVTAHPTAEWIARGGLTFASRCAPEERKPPRGSESQHGHGSDTGHTTPPSYAVTRGRSPSHRRPQPPLLTRSPRTSHTQL